MAAPQSISRHTLHRLTMPLVVCVVLSCEEVKGKSNLKRCTVDVGDGDPFTVVTNAPNVRKDTRTVVATVGTVISIDGEETSVERTAVAGIMSEGVLCDGKVRCEYVHLHSITQQIYTRKLMLTLYTS